MHMIDAPVDPPSAHSSSECAAAASLSTFVWRITASHMTSYFILGWLASTLLDYRSAFATDAVAGYMLGFDSPWVAAGPVLQVARGVLFGLVLWLVREPLIGPPCRAWRLWVLLVGLAILGPAGPAPGSLEGFIYTRVPVRAQLWGMPETVLQTLLFSVTVSTWYRRPSRWWNRGMAGALILITVMCALGVLAALYPDAFEHARGGASRRVGVVSAGRSA